ncbi:MAG: disulfide bond formation protein B [Betaproteobacteria bacterium]|nr:disulfide bond formation protein B [Betaproteobacteria bacterium]
MKPTNIIGLAAAVFSLLFAYLFLQRYLGLVPCPLCILDRIVLAAMAAVFAAGLMVSSPRIQTLLLAVNSLLLASGLLVAGRHVWLQNQPFDESSSCLADSETAQGLGELLSDAFGATSDCGIILWQLFGLSIPDLTLALFALFFVPLLIGQGYAIARARPTS